MSTAVISQPQPFLTSAEQDNVYTVLSFVNLDIPWRSLFPDDLCLSAPHGVVCNFFYEIPLSFSKLKVLDLGYNYFSKIVPESVGNLSELVKEWNDLMLEGKGRVLGRNLAWAFRIGFRDMSRLLAKYTTDITSLEEVCRRVNAKEGNGWV
ncbi:hypothetical protein FF1_040077 [Malus domestica]